MDTGRERTADQIRRHYEVERSLALRLRNATRVERRKLYTAVYDELLRTVPDHPLLVRKASPEESARAVADKMRLLRPFVRADSVCLELGPGDCALSFELSKVCEKVYGVDVSHELTRADERPQNFELKLSDGCSVPVPPNSIDFAYSNALMEHLHPEDAYEQLQNVFAALAPGGAYLCATPNRLRGPNDISKGFDETATGLHLKEYTVTELAHLFRKAGFAKVKQVVKIRKDYRTIPLWPAMLVESALSLLPRSIVKAIARRPPIRHVLGIRIVGYKG
jgi:SAM-dependent methyltransferase